METTTMTKYAVRLICAAVLQAAISILAILAVPILPGAAEVLRVIAMTARYAMPILPGFLVGRDWSVRKRLIVASLSTAIWASIVSGYPPLFDASTQTALVVLAVQVMMSAVISVIPAKQRSQ